MKTMNARKTKADHKANDTHKSWYRQRVELERQLFETVQRDIVNAGGSAVYIVFSSEVPYRIHWSLGGAACPNFAVLSCFRNAIKSRWCGIGPVILVDDRYFNEIFYKDNLDTLTAVSIHEMSHYLSNFSACIVPTSDVLSDLDSKPVIESLAKPFHVLKKSDADPRIVHHANFVRSCLHLSFRMQRTGQDVDLLQLMNWRALGYRSHLEYWRQLHEEMNKTLSLPIGEILKTPVPDGFGEKWFADMLALPRPHGKA